jgi:hypothetical protein
MLSEPPRGSRQAGDSIADVPDRISTALQQDETTKEAGPDFRRPAGACAQTKN